MKDSWNMCYYTPASLDSLHEAEQAEAEICNNL